MSLLTNHLRSASFTIEQLRLGRAYAAEVLRTDAEHDDNAWIAWLDEHRPRPLIDADPERKP